MSSICGIYKIISPSGRVYVGQSVNIKKRWSSYYKQAKSNEGQVRLNNSFSKYGVENHVFEIIEECLEEDLNCRERHWQDFYDVLNGGLNCVLQKCGEQRQVLSEDTLKRKSIASSGERNAMYGKTGESNPNFGKKMSEEMKQIASEKMKGRYDGELNPFFGQKHTPETIEKLSKNAQKRIGEDNPFYGKTHTEEYKRLSSERNKQLYKDNPELILKKKEEMSIGFYYTPNGIFTSQRDAAKANSVVRSTIRMRCVVNSDKPVGFNPQTPKEYRGEKTWREHGWFFIKKDDG